MPVDPPRTVVVIGGDGIGPVVVAAATRVLEAVGFAADFSPVDAGWGTWLETGRAISRPGLDLVARHGLCLFGATTSAPRAVVDTEARRLGISPFVSPILTLRRTLDLDISMRPIRSFPGNPMNFVRRNARGDLEEPGIDMVIFRQNTEGLYSGIGWTDPSPLVRDALSEHPGFARYAGTPGAQLAVEARVATVAASERIAAAAFDYARRHGFATVTVCEKANVMEHTSGLFLEATRRVGRAYPDVVLREMNADALLLRLVHDPAAFGVVVTSNLFGDLVSDAAAGLVGGPGFAASANLGPEAAVFEPAHGSAPDLAAEDPEAANPIAAVLAAAMLLDYVGDAGRARAVRAAVSRVVREGTVRTADMIGGARSRSYTAAAATTEMMTEAIVRALDSPAGEAG